MNPNASHRSYANHANRQRGARRALRRNGARGAVAVEYAMLLVMVAIPTVVGIIADGVNLLKDYKTGRSAILAPSP